MPGKIRVVEIPIGIISFRLRGAWVGLELPTLDPEEVFVANPSEVGLACGSITYDWRKTDGHFVSRAAAVAALRAAGSKIADWWEEYGVGPYLLFDRECCEII